MSSEHPWGLPDISVGQCEELKKHNLLVRFVLKVIRTCIKHRVLWALENPRSSILWELPEIKSFVDKRDVSFTDVDFCRFGTRWRKSTRILSSVVSLAQLSCRCGGKSLCGVSGLAVSTATSMGGAALDFP